MATTFRVALLREGAIVPHRAHADDAGFDLHWCPSPGVGEWTMPTGAVSAFGTGVSIELTRGWEAQIRPRSGLALRNHITVINAPGTIDAGYRGEIIVTLINHGRPYTLVAGQRIAQMVVMRVAEVELALVRYSHLTESMRGTRGFGSTGE